jgi:signal transduction histidine kinase/CheY-like chemotaxis protein
MAGVRLLLAVCAALLITALLAQTTSYRQIDLWLAENTQQPLIAEAFHFTDTLIVDVNEESMARLTPEFGTWPYQRDIYDLVTVYLKDLGAKTVVYDILFSEQREGDEQFARAIERAGNVLLPGVALPRTSRRDDAYQKQLASLAWPLTSDVPTTHWDDITLPRPVFTPPDPTVKFGVINLIPDPEDGILRRVPLFHETYGKHLPNMALAALFNHQPYPPVSYLPNEGRLRVGQHSWPVTGKGEVILQQPKNRDYFMVMPFHKLVFAAMGIPGQAIDPAEVRGKTIFIGSTTAILGDHLSTPRGMTPGLHILALAYQNLAQDLVLRPPRFGWNLLLIAIGIAFPLLAWHRRFQSALSMTLLVVASMAAIYLSSLGLLALHKQQSTLLFALVNSFMLYLALVLSRLKILYDERQRLYYEKLAAEEANQLKSRFLSHITHELRTPLTAILGFNRLLGEDPSLSTASGKAVKTIDQNSEHLLRLINNLLDQAKIEAGQMELDVRPVAIRGMIDGVVDTLGKLAAAKGLELNAVYDTNLPQGLSIDGFRLRQILINLVGNALKFTIHGHIHIKVKWENEWLEIGVEDTGPGIPQAALEKIFEAFQQSDTSVASTHGGTGLGLTISRNLAHLMGGALSVESMLGKGSTFYLRIPAPQAELPSEVTHQPQPSEKLSGRVLLADDSEDARALFKNYFDNMGLSSMFAENGQIAVDIALAEQPDIVLMDMEMPVMSGLEAIQVLRQQGYTKPVLALTAHAGAAMCDKLLQAGFDDCLTKPIKREALKNVLAVALLPLRK